MNVSILSVRGIHICLLYEQSFVTLFLSKDKRWRFMPTEPQTNTFIFMLFWRYKNGRFKREQIPLLRMPLLRNRYYYVYTRENIIIISELGLAVAWKDGSVFTQISFCRKKINDSQQNIQLFFFTNW